MRRQNHPPSWGSLCRWKQILDRLAFVIPQWRRPHGVCARHPTLAPSAAAERQSALVVVYSGGAGAISVSESHQDSLSSAKRKNEWAGSAEAVTRQWVNDALVPVLTRVLLR